MLGWQGLSDKDFLEKRLGLPDGLMISPMIQDKSFNKDGSLFYPDNSNPLNESVPSTPSIFFGNTVVVNGKYGRI